MANAITVPDVLEVIVGEKLNLTWDFANQIAAGDTCSSPTVTVVNSATNETVASAVSGVSVLNNTVIHGTLDTTPLRKKTTYVCTISCLVNGGGTQTPSSAIMIIKVVY